MTGCLLAAGLLLGCGDAAPEDRVVVLVAASTVDAMEAIAARYGDRTGVRVDVSAGPSSGLAAQIRRGAPADLFLSAHPRWTESLRSEGHVVESGSLLTNRLVVVVPADSDVPAGSPFEVLASAAVARIALADRGAPAGRYADDALARAGLAERIAAKVVRSDDVRAALAWVERGEADAAIVYATDAVAARERTRVVHRIDPALHAPIRYTWALVAGAGEHARAFAAYLRGTEAAAIFALHGFQRTE